MIKHVDQYTVATIFPEAGGEKTYKIPKYQREYTWGQKDWNALFYDVVDNDEGYFLGSYICVSDSTMLSSAELIDGQQRFTSLSLLFMALYSALSEFKEDMDDDEKTDFMNLRNQLVNKSKLKDANGKKVYSYSSRLCLQVQNWNNDDYQYMLHECGILEHVKKPAYLGVRRINKAYNYFKACIEDYVEEQVLNDPTWSKMEWLFKLTDKFNSAVMVGIEVDSHKDAYMLFESLNHRGVPLSAIDLIKNVLVASAENDNKTDECYELWREALECVGDDYAVQERFFRQYYNAFRSELNEPFPKDGTKMYPLGYLATRTTLLDIYEKLIKSDYEKFIWDLHKKAEIYSIIVNNSEEETSYTETLKDLERISGAPSYLLLLFLITNQDKMALSEADLRDIITVLITFFVRRSVTDVPNTRKLNKLFMDVIDAIREMKGSGITDTVKEMLREVSASDKEFAQKLRGPLYQDNPDATRFILCSIEAQHQTREIYTGLWNRNKQNVFVWTIEHIFPEGDNVPECWVEMVADGNRSRAEEYRLRYVHTLGNLTVTGYNSSLSNKSFEEKMNRKSKDGSHDIGYRNGLFLNEDVVSENKWTIAQIDQRTEKLAKAASELFAW